MAWLPIGSADEQAWGESETKKSDDIFDGWGTPTTKPAQTETPKAMEDNTRLEAGSSFGNSAGGTWNEPLTGSFPGEKIVPASESGLTRGTSVEQDAKPHDQKEVPKAWTPEHEVIPEDIVPTKVQQAMKFFKFAPGKLADIVKKYSGLKFDPEDPESGKKVNDARLKVRRQRLAYNTVIKEQLADLKNKKSGVDKNSKIVLDRFKEIEAELLVEENLSKAEANRLKIVAASAEGKRVAAIDKLIHVLCADLNVGLERGLTSEQIGVEVAKFEGMALSVDDYAERHNEACGLLDHGLSVLKKTFDDVQTIENQAAKLEEERKEQAWLKYQNDVNGDFNNNFGITGTIEGMEACLERLQVEIHATDLPEKQREHCFVEAVAIKAQDIIVAARAKKADEDQKIKEEKEGWYTLINGYVRDALAVKTIDGYRKAETLLTTQDSQAEKYGIDEMEYICGLHDEVSDKLYVLDKADRDKESTELWFTRQAEAVAACIATNEIVHYNAGIDGIKRFTIWGSFGDRTQEAREYLDAVLVDLADRRDKLVEDGKEDLRRKKITEVLTAIHEGGKEIALGKLYQRGTGFKIHWNEYDLSGLFKDRLDEALQLKTRTFARIDAMMLEVEEEAATDHQAWLKMKADTALSPAELDAEAINDMLKLMGMAIGAVEVKSDVAKGLIATFKDDFEAFAQESFGTFLDENCSK